MAATNHVADPKPSSYEVIERRIADFDIPTVFIGLEIDICLVFDQRQVVTGGTFLVRSPIDERPGFDPAVVPVSAESDPCNGLDDGPLAHLYSHTWCDEELFYRSLAVHGTHSFDNNKESIRETPSK